MDWKPEVVQAKRCYSEQVGFVVDNDVRMGDSFRVVQLTPPGSACSIAIGTGLAEMPPVAVRGMQLVVSDLEAARAELVERGVEVGDVRRVEEEVWSTGRAETRTRSSSSAIPTSTPGRCSTSLLATDRRGPVEVALLQRSRTRGAGSRRPLARRR